MLHKNVTISSGENRTETEKKMEEFFSFFFPSFMRGCVWPRSGPGLDPQAGALSLVCHLISQSCTKGSWSHGPNLARYKVCKGSTCITTEVFTCLPHQGKRLWRCGKQDGEEEVKRKKKRRKKKYLKWKEGTLKFQGIFPDVAQIFCWGNPDVLTLFIPSFCSPFQRLLFLPPFLSFSFYNPLYPSHLQAAHISVPW